jgi:D-glycero-D-manno-heptose 1,7-bisphosphate phosphatase
MRLILLDRDGVLNLDRPDSVKSPAELVLLPGAAAAVARLNQAGRLVVVCTNQGVVGRGIIDEAMLAHIHDKLRTELARAGARLDALIHCPDHPQRPGPRRKPAPGMLREAMTQFRAAPSETVMIGDGLLDLQAALAAGCARVLVRSGKGRATQAAGLPREVLPVAIHEDLASWVAAHLDAPAESPPAETHLPESQS